MLLCIVYCWGNFFLQIRIRAIFDTIEGGGGDEHGAEALRVVFLPESLSGHNIMYIIV